MAFKFPYGAMQQLNLDWFIKQFQKLRADWATAEENIAGSLQDEIDRAEDALSDVFAARDTAVSAKNDAVQAKSDALQASANAAQYWQNAANSASNAAGSAGTALQAAEDAETAETNAAASNTQSGVNKFMAEAWAVGTMNGTPVGSGTIQYNNNAKYYAQQASGDAAQTALDRAAVAQDKDDTDTIKDNANAAALRAEGYADGTQNGTPVTSGSPYYENNAKYYKEAAEDVLESIPPDYTELADEVASQSEKINELKAVINEDNIIYNGTTTAETTVFTSDDVAVGDKIYYELRKAGASSYGLMFYNSSDTRIAYMGRAGSAYGSSEYVNVTEIPTTFAYAKISSGVEAIISRKPTPKYLERYSDNLQHPFNVMSVTAKRSGRTIGSGGADTSTSLPLSITDYIPVMAGDLISISQCLASDTRYMAFYDQNLVNVLAVKSQVYSMNQIVPDGAYYARFTLNNNITTTVINIFSGNEIKAKTANLYKKNITTFGDSITWYDGELYNRGQEDGKICVGYQSYMRASGLIVDNQGVSGATMPQILTKVKAKTYTNVDIVSITSGANDTKNGVTLGTISAIGSTFAEDTFYGALQSAVEYILTQKPSIKIVLFTPIKGTIYPDTDISTDFVTAIKNVGNLYGLPVCDLYNQSGINKLTYSVYMNDTADTQDYILHPTKAGFKRMADIIIPFLKNVFTDSVPDTLL